MRIYSKDQINEVGKIQFDLRENLGEMDMFTLFEEPIVTGDIEKLLIMGYKFGSEMALQSKEKFEEQNNLKLQCKQGCFYCCKSPIQILPFEKIIIKNQLKKLGNEEKSEIKGNIKMVKEKIKTSVKAKKYTNQYKDQYLANEIYCPFLNNNSKECGVYEGRPLSCLNYFEYASSDNCDNNAFSPTAVNFEDIKYTVIFVLIHAIDAYSKYNNVNSEILRNRYLGFSKINEYPYLANMGKLEMLPNAFVNADFN